jgi:hypothetical protein
MPRVTLADSRESQPGSAAVGRFTVACMRALGRRFSSRAVVAYGRRDKWIMDIGSAGVNVMMGKLLYCRG